MTFDAASVQPISDQFVPMTFPIDERMERMAVELEASGRYRILRRIESDPQPMQIECPSLKTGIFLDVETTGLDVDHDEIIELAMVPFRYDDKGNVRSVLPAFSALRDPGCPIPADVTALTGLTQELVAGHVIGADDVSQFVRQSKASLFVAHNANFDRRFCERLCGTFVSLPWACSLNEVPWREEGFEGSKLSHLANGHGLFFDGHRAVHDCLAGIEILRRPLLGSGRIGLAVLLESARMARWRIWAIGSPFQTKDILKRRGYRWNDGSDGRPRSWYADVADESRELEFLSTEIYCRTAAEIVSRRVTAFDRYSCRV